MQPKRKIKRKKIIDDKTSTPAQIAEAQKIVTEAKQTQADWSAGGIYNQALDVVTALTVDKTAGQGGAATANAVGAVMAKQIGDIADKNKWAEGSTEKVILHGLAGLVQAKLGGTSELSGLTAGATKEALTPLMESFLKSQGYSYGSAEFNDMMKLGSTLIGAATGAAVGGGAQNINVGANIALNAEQNNRQLHESEIRKLAALAGDFKKRLKAEGIEVTEKEAFSRLLAQAAKDVDTVTFKDRANDVIAEAFLSLNRSGSFTVDGKLYKDFQAQSKEERNDHSLFKANADKYDTLYTSANQSKPSESKTWFEGAEVAYWKSQLTTKERAEATQALFKGDAKALASMAQSAGQFALDTLVLGDTNSVGKPIYDEAAARMEARFAAAKEIVTTNPAITASKMADGMRQQLAVIDNLRAQGKLDEANDKLGELGTQLIVASKGLSGTALLAVDVTKATTGIVVKKVDAVADKIAQEAFVKSGGVMSEHGVPLLDLKQLSNQQKAVMGELFGENTVKQIIPDGQKLARVPGPGETGIDDLYKVNRADVDYVVIEYKFDTSKQGKTADGLQASDNWVLGSGRLEKAVGSEKMSNDIAVAMKLGRTETWIVRTLPDGSTQIQVLDSFGKPKPIDTSKIILPKKKG